MKVHSLILLMVLLTVQLALAKTVKIKNLTVEQKKTFAEVVENEMKERAVFQVPPKKGPYIKGCSPVEMVARMDFFTDIFKSRPEGCLLSGAVVFKGPDIDQNTYLVLEASGLVRYAEALDQVVEYATEKYLKIISMRFDKSCRIENILMFPHDFAGDEDRTVIPPINFSSQGEIFFKYKSPKTATVQNESSRNQIMKFMAALERSQAFCSSAR